MRPSESFLNQPIRDLQTMLRVLAKHRGDPAALIPDGIYGETTMQAVSDFQKLHGLPPTGAADNETWKAILKAYQPARTDLIPAQPLYIQLNAGEVIGSGQENPNIYLIQAMLEVLSQAYQSVSSPGFSGILDEKTEKSIVSFQILCRLEPDGKLNKITWKNLVLQYPLAAGFSRPLREESSGISR